jgi:prepilin-type N-terminal cleavage/methylation domain-containing protein
MRRKGFTLIELLVVIAIIAVLWPAPHFLVQ